MSDTAQKPDNWGHQVTLGKLFGKKQGLQQKGNESEK